MNDELPFGDRRRAISLALLGLAFALRLFDLQGPSLWHDEAFSWTVARVDWSVFWPALVADGVHPPGYYLLLRAAISLFGDSEFALRFPSVVAGVLAVALLMRLGRAIAGPRAGLVAGLLAALNPFALWYAREARMYSLLLCLTAAGGWFFWRLTRRPARPAWLGLALTTALAFLLHYFAFVFSLAQFVYLVLDLRRTYRSLRWWVAAQTAAFIPFLPWAVALVTREGKNFGIGWIPRPALTDPPLTLANLLLALDDPASRWTWPGAVLALGLVVLGAVRLSPGRWRFLLAWLAAPLVFGWLISLKLPVYVDRQFIIVLPALLLLVAAGLASPLRLARLGLVILVGVMLLSGLRLWLDPHFAKEDWREAAAIITRQARPGDALVMQSLMSRFPFSYYYRGPLTLEVATVNQDTVPPERLAAGRKRLWLVYRRPFVSTHALAESGPFTWQDDPNPLWRPWLAAHRSYIRQTFTLPGVYMVLFDLP